MGEERSRVVKNGLLALGSAAVVAVYAAGYDRTQAAAQRFSADDTVRRPPVPVVTPPLPDASRPSNTTGRTRPLVSTSVGPGAIDSIRSPTVVAAEPSTAVATPSPTIAAPARQPLTPSVTPPVTPPADTPVTMLAAPPVAPPTAAHAAAQGTPQAGRLKDGSYSGWGTSRHGDIQASIVIDSGRVVAAWIERCLTRYSCSWISHLPQQVVNRQSPDVDFVSGATQSVSAFYYAIVDALSKAR